MNLRLDRELKTNLKKAEFELLAPANNKETAVKAIKTGADAVYMGYSKYGARVHAGNSIEDIIETIEFAHQYRVKVYITINTILDDEELKRAEKLIWKLYKIKADGIIIQDMGLLECSLPPVKLCASTQCNNNTLEKIKFLEDAGINRVILPREITLNEIREIKAQTNIELECFIHGSLCVSYSGQCYMSRIIGGRSANRGECAQPCRKKYSLKDADGRYIIRNKYILSLKDLNLSNRLEELIEAGITSFKIEGRLKNESYVTNTTAYYRELTDKILKNYNLKRSSQGSSAYDFEADLSKTYNRGFTEFNIDGKIKESATVYYTSSAGEYIGIVRQAKKNYFTLNSNILNNGDGICFFDKNAMLGTNINKTEGNIIYPAEIKGIKQGTKIYRNYNKNFETQLKNAVITRKIPLKLRIRETDSSYLFFLEDEEKNCVCHIELKKYEPARNQKKAEQTLKIQLEKCGNTIFSIENTDIKINKIPFIKVSRINEIRRILTCRMEKIRNKNYKYKERLTPLNTVKYPQKELNYKSNIFNQKAEDFYKKCGCIIKERALEQQKSAEKGMDIMTSKYCIRNQLNMCTKKINTKKYKEPFVLTDEFNKEYLVEFDCKECVMKIKYLN